MLVAVIYALGAIHGLFLALVLAQKEVNKLPNRLLAMLMVVFSIDLGMAAFQSFGLHTQHPHFIGLDYPITLLYGPLLFLYVKTMRDGAKQHSSLDYLHFIPFVVLVLYMIPFYAGPAADKLALISSAAKADTTYGFGFINDIKVLHGLAYVAGVVCMLFSYRRKLKDSYSTIEKINLNWLQNFIIGTAILAALAAGFHFIPMAKETVLMGLSESIYDDLTLLSVTAFVYGIGYMGLHQPEVFANSKTVLDNTQPAKQNTKHKYQKSGLDQEEAKRCSKLLVQAMEEGKLYRNSELKLRDLADQLDIPPHNLTEVINTHLDQNFYDFVNNYRVEEVKQKLRDPISHDLTLLGIGLDAGFNSKSTFNSVFKKQTGMTPSQFRKKHSAGNKNSP